uniref:Uncharacterized protein n=1 Tax=Chelonoidis abingdonii TaxID=106734 RepID=A0A8C0H340_CHEAB
IHPSVFIIFNVFVIEPCAMPVCLLPLSHIPDESSCKPEGGSLGNIQELLGRGSSLPKGVSSTRSEPGAQCPAPVGGVLQSSHGGGGGLPPSLQ